MAAAALTQLADALAEERSALLEHDIPRLLASSQRKCDALQALESNPPAEDDARLPELIEANRLNGALLARRRRELDILLRHFGHAEHPVAYDAHGHSRNLPPRRVLAVV